MNEPASFCRSPCTDPEQTAKDRGLPPEPPASRDPPRSIPGLPSSHSQPTIPKDGNDDQEPLQHLELRSEKSGGKHTYSDVDHAGDDLLSPPYRIENHAGDGDLSDLTMDTNLRHANGEWTYDTHNLYGMCKSTLACYNTYKVLMSASDGHGHPHRHAQTKTQPSSIHHYTEHIRRLREIRVQMARRQLLPMGSLVHHPP